MSGSKWIFGLSVDEEVTWAAAQVERIGAKKYAYMRGKENFCYGKFSDLGNEPIVLQDSLNREIESFFVENSDLASRISAVGVSSIGIVDTERKFLERIARKKWLPPQSGDNSILPVGNFPALFRDKLKKNVPIRVQNDATAKCLAEYHWQDPSDRQDLIFYALFSEGVNGALVDKGTPLARISHQLLGHIYPRLHNADHAFNEKFSGCPIHGFCFEGVASGARLRKEWIEFRNVNIFKNEEHDIWNVMASYIAQFCWTAVLITPMERILIGGSVPFPNLIPKIRMKFLELNKGNAGKPYIHYEKMDDPGFIQMARLGDKAGMLGALELARLELEQAPEAIFRGLTVVK